MDKEKQFRIQNSEKVITSRRGHTSIKSGMKINNMENEKNVGTQKNLFFMLTET
jgi:hypothetical protein